MSNCPPAPSYVREQGIADCDYLQMTPFQRQALRNENLAQRPFSDLLRNHPYPHAYYKIGGYPMTSLGFYRKAPPSIGRSQLPLSTAKKRSNQQDYPTTWKAPYSGYNDELFIKDLWTAQLLVLWLSDGLAYPPEYTNSQNIVTKRGYSPSNISPLQISSNGHALTDVRQLLNPQGQKSDVKFVQGPDGMFGDSGNDLVAEWIRTGKLYNRTVPQGSAHIALNRLAQGISTPQIEAAKAAKAAGNTTPKTETAKTPCNQLADHMLTAAGCPPRTTGGGGGGGGTGDTPAEDTIPNKPPKKRKGTGTPAKGEDNMLLYGGIAAGVLLVGGGSYLYMKKKKKAQGLA